MLPEAIPEARIFVYDWDANCFNDAPVKTLLGHGDTLLRLVAASRGSELRPIIFVASCFGGLILAEVCTSLRFPTKRIDISRRLSGGRHRKATLIAEFYSRRSESYSSPPPFRGSDAAKQAQWGVAVAGIMGEQTSRQLVDDLCHNDPKLRILTQEFAEIARRESVQLPVHCFYETKRTEILGRLLPSSFAKRLSIGMNRKTYKIVCCFPTCFLISQTHIRD